MKAYDLHRPAAFRTNQRIDFVNLLDERGPSNARGCRLCRRGGVVAGWCGLFGEPRGLGPATPGFVGIPTIIADLMLSTVGNVLSDLGKKVEGIEEFEITGESSDGWDGAPVWEVTRVGMFGAVEDLAVRIDFDHASLAEGAAGNILGKFFQSIRVAGVYADILVNAEAAMPPCAHGLDHPIVDSSFVQ